MVILHNQHIRGHSSQSLPFGVLKVGREHCEQFHGSANKLKKKEK